MSSFYRWAAEDQMFLDNAVKVTAQPEVAQRALRQAELGGRWSGIDYLGKLLASVPRHTGEYPVEALSFAVAAIRAAGDARLEASAALSAAEGASNSPGGPGFVAFKETWIQKKSVAIVMSAVAVELARYSVTLNERARGDHQWQGMHDAAVEVADFVEMATKASAKSSSLAEKAADWDLAKRPRQRR